MSLVNIATIKKIIKDNSIYPDSHSGQNFLVDAMVLQTIIETAHIKPGENILEIGPGLGVLTAELLAAGAQVTAVEKDKQLFAYLKKRFQSAGNLTLVNDNILKYKITAEPYRIVANIPYSITAKIIKKFTTDETNKPASLLILVQKEVGKRVCAKPGKLNLLAICVQLYGQPSIIANIPAKAFYPAPKVDSCLLLIDKIKAKTPYPIPDLAQFWRVLRLGFSSPRKQLHNNIASGLKISNSAIKDSFKRVGLGDKARAQELAIEQWIKLIEKLG